MKRKQPQDSPSLFSPTFGRDSLLKVAKALMEKGASNEKLRKFARESGKVRVDVAQKQAPSFLRRLKRDAPRMLNERGAMFTGFEARLYYTWQKPLELLEMLLVIASEAGETMSKEWPWGKSRDKDLVFDVLRQLQARGCQVASEILTLLKAGYASGAHARWRTLHETAVTALFISEHGKDVAQAYLDHEHVESFTAAQRYQKYCRKLGYAPYSKRQMDEITANYDRVLAAHGPLFGGGYGWAAKPLGRTDTRFGFGQIESAVKLDHLRPYYQLASHTVHANPMAIAFTLCLLPGQKLMLTGPSNQGLADPGHSTALTLSLLTVTLVTQLPSVGSLLLCNVMDLLVDQIGRAFLETHRAVQRRGLKEIARDTRAAARKASARKK